MGEDKKGTYEVFGYAVRLYMILLKLKDGRKTCSKFLGKNKKGK